MERRNRFWIPLHSINNENLIKALAVSLGAGLIGILAIGVEGAAGAGAGAAGAAAAGAAGAAGAAAGAAAAPAAVLPIAGIAVGVGVIMYNRTNWNKEEATIDF